MATYTNQLTVPPRHLSSPAGGTNARGHRFRLTYPLPFGTIVPEYELAQVRPSTHRFRGRPPRLPLPTSGCRGRRLGPLHPLGWALPPGAFLRSGLRVAASSHARRGDAPISSRFDGSFRAARGMSKLPGLCGSAELSTGKKWRGCLFVGPHHRPGRPRVRRPSRASAFPAPFPLRDGSKERDLPSISPSLGVHCSNFLTYFRNSIPA